MTDDKLEILDGQQQIPENKMGMVKGQMQMAGNKMELNPGGKLLVIAARAISICASMMLSIEAIEMFGALMFADHSSIAANVGKQMSRISTDSSAIRRGDAPLKSEPRDFVIPAARVARETTNMNARLSNGFARFDLAPRTILGDRLSSRERASTRPRFAHEDSADDDFAARIHDHIQIDDRAMSGAVTGESAKLLLQHGVGVCRFDSNNLIVTDTAAQLTMPNATAIYSGHSNDQVIVDRHRIQRERTTALLLKQNMPETQVIIISE
jgi:hypothetical protein